MAQRTKKQHYIPNKSYLEYFTDKNSKLLQVYANTKDLREFSTNPTAKNILPADFCKETYLYETPRLKVNAIENIFSTIESQYKNTLDTKILKKVDLSPQDKIVLSYFFSSLEVRTPLNKSHTESTYDEMLEMAKSMEKQFAKGEKSKFSQNIEKLKKENMPLVLTVLAGLEVNRFRFCDYLFLSPIIEDEEMHFITSDFPVSLTDFANMNTFYAPVPMDVTAEVIIPLTHNLAVFVNNIGLNGYEKIDYNMVREINSRTLRRANKYIISSRGLDSAFIQNIVRRYPQSFIMYFLQKELADNRNKRMGVVSGSTP